MGQWFADKKKHIIIAMIVAAAAAATGLPAPILETVTTYAYSLFESSQPSTAPSQAPAEQK